MTKLAPFADTRGTLAILTGSLLDVESGEATPGRVFLVRDARIEAVLRHEMASRTARRSSTCPASRSCLA